MKNPFVLETVSIKDNFKFSLGFRLLGSIEPISQDFNSRIDDGFAVIIEASVTDFALFCFLPQRVAAAAEVHTSKVD